LVTHHAALQDRVRTRLLDRGLADVRVLDRDPVHGAAALAGQPLDPAHPRKAS
jgi:hypothetical protein